MITSCRLKKHGLKQEQLKAFWLSKNALKYKSAGNASAFFYADMWFSFLLFCGLSCFKEFI